MKITHKIIRYIALISSLLGSSAKGAVYLDGWLTTAGTTSSGSVTVAGNVLSVKYLQAQSIHSGTGFSWGDPNFTAWYGEKYYSDGATMTNYWTSGNTYTDIELFNGATRIHSGFQSGVNGYSFLALGMPVTNTGSSVVLGTTGNYLLSKTVVGQQNPGGTVDASNIFRVYAPTATANAFRILNDGTILIRPSNSLSMGGFTSGTAP